MGFCVFSVLSHRTYRHLFLAQVVALLGTGLATVALGLLAWDLTGGEAGQVLGTALAIKMIAYVCLSPIMQVIADRMSRRTLLVCLDLIRAAVAVSLPFVTEVWQIYVLIFFLQAASAGFTPTFQATIPDVLPDEGDYTKALSLSRLAYDLESLISPLLAALLLTLVSFQTLFVGTVIGFLLSALLVISVILPDPLRKEPRDIWTSLTRGTRIYLATPRLRGLLALSFAVSSVGAMVIVNTVVIVRQTLGLSDEAVALTLGVFGGGSMIAALGLPKLLDGISDRAVMLGGTLIMTGSLGFAAGFSLMNGVSWPVLIIAWGFIGLGFSATLTPSGRLLRRSGHSEDRPALFAAQFALSHACWLITYPLAGWLQSTFGSALAMAALLLSGGLGLAVALWIWPRHDPVEVTHSHDDLPADHPHVTTGHRHSHAFVIDDLHPRWPENREISRGV